MMVMVSVVHDGPLFPIGFNVRPEDELVIHARKCFTAVLRNINNENETVIYYIRVNKYTPVTQ